MRKMLFISLLLTWSSTAFVVLAPYEETLQKEEKQTHIARQYESFPKEEKRTNIARQVMKSKISKKSS